MQHYADRYTPYYDTVKADPQPGYVFAQHSAYSKALESMMQNNKNYIHIVLDGYDVYYARK
jgi:hypothetical protein